MNKNEVWKQLSKLVIDYRNHLHKFEIPLFNIQKHPKLPADQRLKFKEFYNQLKKHIHNLDVMKEELNKKANLDEAEKVVVADLSEKIVFGALEFIKMLSKEINRHG